MKKLFKVAALSAAFMTAGIAQAADTIGFADPGYILQNHPVLLDAAAKFDAFMKSNETQFAEEDKKLAEENKALTAERAGIEADAKKLKAEQGNLEASLKKQVAQLEKDAPRLRAKEIQARQDKIMASQKGFQNKVEALQKKIEDANKNSGGLNPQEAQKQAVDEINVTIKEVAKAKGYTLVLQPQVALYAEDESKDITEAVLDAIKAKHPEIKLPEPKAEEQPAAEAPKAAEEAKPQATEEAKK